MRKILSLALVAVAVIGLAFFGGCGEEKGKKKQSAAASAPVSGIRATTPAVVKAETLSTEIEQSYASAASANAIPDSINPDLAPAPSRPAGKSAYRLSHEARSVSAASVQTAERPVILATRMGKAEIDSDLVNFGRGNTGASTRYLDLDGPEIGRDIDVPKFVILRGQRVPVAQVNDLKNRTAIKPLNREVGPEIGWVTGSHKSAW